MTMPGLRVGLTGGIASGKTTAARRFAELGATVIDADEVARALVEPGMPALAEIVARFGDGVLGADRRLDRRALRERVFRDPAARRDLEAILHPRIRAEMTRRTAAASGPYAILVIPLLIEGGPRDDLDRVLVVDVTEATQHRRLLERDRVPAALADSMLAAQARRAERLARADDVLPNEGSLAALHAGVDALHRRYLALAAAHALPPSGGPSAAADP